MTSRVTRGNGFLEGLLSRLRARQANRLIRDEQRRGRILDVGCGSYPQFLLGTPFAEKHGVDKLVTHGDICALADRVVLRRFEVHEEDSLPYPDEYFDTVTMLAVFEHIAPERLVILISEIHRVLKQGGTYVMTTPSSVSGPVLECLKFLGAVSKEEIDEHQDSYSRNKILAIMGRTEFMTQDIRMGVFEFGLNIWMVADKRSTLLH